MEVPKYSLNFEIDACFDIKEDIVKNIDEHSTITLSKSKTKNTGSITFEIDTLNQKEAEDKRKIDSQRFSQLLSCCIKSR